MEKRCLCAADTLEQLPNAPLLCVVQAVQASIDKVQKKLEAFLSKDVSEREAGMYSIKDR